MEKTYAALYIPRKTKNISSTNTNRINKAKQVFCNAIKTANISLKNFNPSSIASFFATKGKSEFNFRYAISGLSEIIGKGNIKNLTKLNCFLNICSPILNLNITKTGCNSLKQFKERLYSGNINTAGLLSLIYDGINIQRAQNNINYTGLGEELPIDVIERCEYKFQENIAKHPVFFNQNNNFWISDLGLVKINLIGHIKNSNGELVKTNTYMQKIGDCMKNKLPVTLRIGKDVYENCIIENVSPVLTNIYELKLNMTLKYNYSLDTNKKSVFGGTILNPGNNYAYLLSQERYAGTFS